MRQENDVPRKILTEPRDIKILHADINREPILSAFSKYCCSLARESKTGSIERVTFDPMKVTKSLPFIVLNEIISDKVVRIRLLGTEIEPIFGGGSATGKNVIEFLPEYRRNAAYEFFKRTADHNYVTLQEEDLMVADGKIIACDTLGFPMVGKDGKRSLRMTASSIRFKNRELEKERDFQVVQNKIHSIRYVTLQDFAWHRDAKSE